MKRTSPPEGPATEEPAGPRKRSTDGVARPKGRTSAAGEARPPLAGRARRICTRLAASYPHATCSLNFDGPYQLLIATILSAQCTDRRVNAVTGPLFARWPGPGDLAEAPPAEIEAAIRSTGFFRSKARNIRGCAAAIVERHDGAVPTRLEDLVRLPGVGRKTANVVLGSAMGQSAGIVVDTHVGRLARRLGLSRASNPVVVERDLARIVPRRHWISLSHWLIEHGRAVCRARRPRCDQCVLARMCPRVGVGQKPPADRPRGRGKRAS